jgi:hypothetical protein
VADERAEIFTRSANDLGGLPAGRLVPTDHELLPWEKRAHALLDVLDAKAIVNTEEKRRGIDELGRDIYDKLTYYEKWVLSACNVLLTKGVLTSEELARKLAEVKAREVARGRQVLS